MALKDWEKIGKFHWKNTITGERIDMGSGSNITQDESSDSPWKNKDYTTTVYKYWKNGFSKDILKEFHEKEDKYKHTRVDKQALKYAKSYMRKN